MPKKTTQQNKWQQESFTYSPKEFEEIAHFTSGRFNMNNKQQLIPHEGDYMYSFNEDGSVKKILYKVDAPLVLLNNSILITSSSIEGENDELLHFLFKKTQ